MAVNACDKNWFPPPIVCYPDYRYRRILEWYTPRAYVETGAIIYRQWSWSCGRWWNLFRWNHINFVWDPERYWIHMPLSWCAVKVCHSHLWYLMAPSKVPRLLPKKGNISSEPPNWSPLWSILAYQRNRDKSQALTRISVRAIPMIPFRYL